MGLSESRTLHPGGSARLSLAFVTALLAVVAMTLLSAPSASARSHGDVLLFKHRLHLRRGDHVPLRVLREVRREVRRLRRGTKGAHAAIVGGSGVPISIVQAPWQVEVLSFVIEDEELIGVVECGGSIVGESKVVTAGHCMYDPENGELIPAGDIIVVAGSSDFEEVETGEQERRASGVHVEPNFNYDAEATHAIPDDVAVVEVSTSFEFDERVKEIALGAAGSRLSEGTALGLTGSGRESAEAEANGKLYALTTKLGFSGQCGGEADALFLCTSTPEGSVCFGDSGSGLTLPGATPSLVGVADTVEIIDEQACVRGAGNGFVNVTAPEIRDFIIDPTIASPLAPRGGGGVGIYGTTEPGNQLTCEPGNWSGSPLLTYAFINNVNSQVLQEGDSTTYLLSSADIGRSIYCEVFAANTGGTGVARSIVLAPVASGDVIKVGTGTTTVEEHKAGGSTAKPSVRVAGTTLSVSKGSAVVKLACSGSAACHGKLTLTATKTEKVKGKRRKRTVTIGTMAFSLAGGASTKVKIGLSSYARGQLKHGRLHASLSILGIETEPSHARAESVTLQ